jgi:hypothetical protein
MTAPRVTDHAVLRYLERARGFDVEAVRVHIATLCAPAVAAGASTFRAEGVRFEFQGPTVVTVAPGGNTISQTRRSLMADKIARGGGD